MVFAEPLHGIGLLLILVGSCIRVRVCVWTAIYQQRLRVAIVFHAGIQGIGPIDESVPMMRPQARAAHIVILVVMIVALGRIIVVRR